MEPITPAEPPTPSVNLFRANEDEKPSRETTEKKMESLDQVESSYSSNRLSDEYNPDDEVLDDSMSYGWDYNAGLDNEIEEKPYELDEDEAYAKTTAKDYEE